MQGREALTDAWTRPSGWLDYDEPGADEEKLIGIAAVLEDAAGVSNIYSLRCTVTGGYTVDWGDGSAPENVASNVVAEHTYDWDDLDVSSEYTQNGLTVRQALVTVTPQGANGFSYFDLIYPYTGYTSGTYLVARWLEWTIASPTMQRCRFSYWVANYVTAIWLEHVKILCTNLDSCYYMFHSCWNLRYVDWFDTSQVTSMAAMFYSCRALEWIPELDTHLVTTMYYMFSQCWNIRELPDSFTFPVCTNFDYFTYYCPQLRRYPAHYTFPAMTDCYGMVRNCFGLLEAPDLGSFAFAADEFKDHFYNCQSLQSLPSTVYDTSSVTDFTEAFYACYGLSALPLYDTSLVTKFYRAVYATRGISYIPAWDMRAASSLANMYQCFYANRGLAWADVWGCTYGMDFSHCNLSREAIMNIIANAGTAAGGAQNLTVTGNPGASDITAGDQATAAAKGWTIVT